MLLKEDCPYYTPCGICTRRAAPCRADESGGVHKDRINLKDSDPGGICKNYVFEFGKGVCYGTKEREPCPSGGNAAQCRLAFRSGG